MNAQAFLKAASVALDVLPKIAAMAHVSSDKVTPELTAVKAALDAVIAGVDGFTSPQEMLTRVEQLHAELAANDATADAALDAKFAGKK